MDSKRLIQVLLSVATTSFSVALLGSYTLVIPQWEPLRAGISTGVASAMLAWIATAFIVALIGWFGMAWSVFKMLRVQSGTGCSGLFTFNPFRRFSKQYLDARGQTAQRHFLIFMCAFLFATVSGASLVLFGSHLAGQ